MSEISDVLAAIESLSERGERMALATIVAVKGSTYRRPGARLLVPEEGDLIGNISGGCLEGDVADVARIVMREGVARMVSFDPGTEWTLSSVKQGARLVVPPGREAEGSLGDGAVDASARDAAEELLAAERSEIRELAGGVRAFVEVLEPPLRLLVCGAGHDATPVVEAAALLGWNPVVVDDRPAFLTKERFPEATGFVQVERPEQAADLAPVDDRTHVVVMTHRFMNDKQYLRSFLRSPAAYIAMLGPAARTQRILMELREEGVGITEGDMARIHGPAGLDLGAEGPEEIAHAIVAEIVAKKRGRGAGVLRGRRGPITDR